MKGKMVLLAYGALSIGNGVYRYIGDPQGGQTGLIFGLVMGAMSLIASYLVDHDSRALRISGYVLAAMAILMTGGFFVFALAKKPDEYGTIRPVLMAVASALAAIVIVAGARTRSV